MAKAVHRNLRIDNISYSEGLFTDILNPSLTQLGSIDLAFIDAIHTKEFVVPQLDMVVARSNNKAIIILDDINFSDNMRECWRAVSTDNRFTASATLGNSVGILELR